MGKKIGFGFLALFMGSCSMIFLTVPFQSTGDDGVTFFSGILMALVWGAVALLSVLIVLGKYDPSNVHWGWGTLAFICGNLAAVGIGSAFSPHGSGNLFAGIVCAMLTFFCVRKAGNRHLLPGGRLLPEGRTYTPGDPLPTSVCPGLLLTRGEVGHLCETVKIGKVKNVSTGTVTTRSGGSVRVARGLSIHSGTSHSKTMRADVLDTSPGTLYVTSKRVIGSSSKYSFDEKISSLTSVKMYSDGFALQFGSKNYTILVRDPTYVATILQIANRLSV